MAALQHGLGRLLVDFELLGAFAHLRSLDRYDSGLWRAAKVVGSDERGKFLQSGWGHLYGHAANPAVIRFWVSNHVVAYERHHDFTNFVGRVDAAEKRLGQRQARFLVAVADDAPVLDHS